MSGTPSRRHEVCPSLGNAELGGSQACRPELGPAENIWASAQLGTGLWGCVHVCEFRASQFSDLRLGSSMKGGQPQDFKGKSLFNFSVGLSAVESKARPAVPDAGLENHFPRDTGRPRPKPSEPAKQALPSPGRPPRQSEFDFGELFFSPEAWRCVLPSAK